MRRKAGHVVRLVDSGMARQNWGQTKGGVQWLQLMRINLYGILGMKSNEYPSVQKKYLTLPNWYSWGKKISGSIGSRSSTEWCLAGMLSDQTTSQGASTGLLFVNYPKCRGEIQAPG